MEGFGELMTQEEAAEFLKVHPNTLARWRKRGRVRALRTPGGELRFWESDVRSALQEEKHDHREAALV